MIGRETGEMLESDYLSDDSRFIEKLGKIPTLKGFQTEHLRGMLRLSKVRKMNQGS
jgi:hypothetical protein